LLETGVDLRRPVRAARGEQDDDEEDGEGNPTSGGRADCQNVTETAAAGPECPLSAVETAGLEELVDLDLGGRNQRAEDDQRGDDTDGADDSELADGADRTHEIREEADDGRGRHPDEGGTHAAQRDRHRAANGPAGAVRFTLLTGRFAPRLLVRDPLRLALFPMAHEHVNRVVDRQADQEDRHRDEHLVERDVRPAHEAERPDEDGDDAGDPEDDVQRVAVRDQQRDDDEQHCERADDGQTVTHRSVDLVGDDAAAEDEVVLFVCLGPTHESRVDCR